MLIIKGTERHDHTTLINQAGAVRVLHKGMESWDALASLPATL